jgi:hypothetical protein
MTDETEIPGQQTIDEVTEAPASAPAAEHAEDVTPESDPTPADSAAEPSGSSADATADSASPAGTSSDTPDESWFRVMTELRNPGNPVPHSVIATESMLAEDAIKFLARHVHDLPGLIATLEELL